MYFWISNGFFNEKNKFVDLKSFVKGIFLSIIYSFPLIFIRNFEALIDGAGLNSLEIWLEF